MDNPDDLAKIYQKKSQIEHILDAPDTYIGATEADEIKNWIFEDDKLVYKKFSWIPGLYKCFDEGIVNCRDHFIRLMQKIHKKEKNIKPVTLIDIHIDRESGIITMYNDGNGIDVAMHPEHNMYIPEMIFGHLMTSTNYKKNVKKIVGGKNGFGFKLVLIYSVWGRIETVDHIRGLKYTQEFEKNLSVIKKPVISKCKKNVEPYTKVAFKLDFKRFGIPSFTDDMFNLLKKRTYDIAAVTDKSVRVRFNHQMIPVRTFEQYINLYIGNENEPKRIYEKQSRWEYAICLAPMDEFTHIAFVNGVYTSKGGKHVDYILNQIVRKVSLYIEKKKKIKVKAVTIKEQLMLFINCVIENPSFDSQTKDYLNTPVSKFGSRCEVSDKCIDKIIKMGVMDAAISLTEIKAQKLAKKTDGRKTCTIRGIPKLIDANYAGGSRSRQCILILCEGDSAKSGIVSGLSKEDRNIYGIFPLKGKLLNAKDALQAKLNNNQEITNIKKILGLETNQHYDNITQVKNKLRYGKILFMTDQDLDGAHIKGLCINLFHSQWHDLIKLDSFLGFMNTPILKAKKGNKHLNFYNEQEYQKWKDKNNNGKGWKIKYYKGLGTSTAKEFKEYFRDKKEVYFRYSGIGCDDAIDKVFNKKRADDRKDWLRRYDKTDILNFDSTNITYAQFVDKEMIHFSKYDCERSIPNLMDGLKISMRKILFAAFKRKLTSEIKVAQFAGYISEHACYHHGEKSLVGAIINMAQEFTGSNNINLFLPNGQFGTRLKGGKDSASERYIFTQLTSITNYIYAVSDNPILAYNDDDGTLVEPEYYAPIIPMVLVNGGKGIGTGFSYEGLCYNPLQIIKYIQYKLKKKGSALPTIEPYYEGFKGKITAINSSKFLIKGIYRMIGTDKIHITELPIGTWTEDYKAFLESIIDDGKKKKKAIIKNYTDMSTDTEVDFTIKLVPGTMNALLPKQIEYGCNGLEKALRLYTTKTTTNMYLFDAEQKLKKYKTIYDIIDAYYPVRHRLYIARKAHQIKCLERLVMILHNKAKFIEEQCDNIIDLRRKKKMAVIELLKSRKYDIIDGDDEYKYLRRMSIEQVEEENMQKLRNERDEKRNELSILRAKSIESIWGNELRLLMIQYKKYKVSRYNRQKGIGKKRIKRGKVKLKKNIIKN